MAQGNEHSTGVNDLATHWRNDDPMTADEIAAYDRCSARAVRALLQGVPPVAGRVRYRRWRPSQYIARKYAARAS